MRERHHMPNDIAAALKSSGLRADYIGWINRAKTSETRIKRLEQMLTELAQGGIYMGMEHKASRK